MDPLLTKNKDDARDLYQETAFRAIKNKEKFTPGTNFKAWLMTIMKNIFINNYRKKSKLNTISDSTDNMYYINSGKNANLGIRAHLSGYKFILYVSSNIFPVP